MKPLATCQCPKWPDEGPCPRTATAEDLLCDGCRPAKPGAVNNCSRIQFGDQRATGHWQIPALLDLRLPLEAAHGWEPKRVDW